MIRIFSDVPASCGPVACVPLAHQQSPLGLQLIHTEKQNVFLMSHVANREPGHRNTERHIVNTYIYDIYIYIYLKILYPSPNDISQNHKQAEAHSVSKHLMNVCLSEEETSSSLFRSFPLVVIGLSFCLLIVLQFSMLSDCYYQTASDRHYLPT